MSEVVLSPMHYILIRTEPFFQETVSNHISRIVIQLLLQKGTKSIVHC